jgi:hypothetical protein
VGTAQGRRRGVWAAARRGAWRRDGEGHGAGTCGRMDGEGHDAGACGRRGVCAQGRRGARRRDDEGRGVGTALGGAARGVGHRGVWAQGRVGTGTARGMVQGRRWAARRGALGIGACGRRDVWAQGQRGARCRDGVGRRGEGRWAATGFKSSGAARGVGRWRDSNRATRGGTI